MPSRWVLDVKRPSSRGEVIMGQASHRKYDSLGDAYGETSPSARKPVERLETLVEQRAYKGDHRIVVEGIPVSAMQKIREALRNLGCTLDDFFYEEDYVNAEVVQFENMMPDYQRRTVVDSSDVAF